MKLVCLLGTAPSRVNPCGFKKKGEICGIELCRKCGGHKVITYNQMVHVQEFHKRGAFACRCDKQ